MFDLSTKYCFHLNKNSKKSLELFLLLHTIEKYVNGAIIEMSRLEKTRQNIIKKLSALRNPEYIRSRKKDFQLTYLGCDTHFFFICIDKCYKLLNQLSIELEDKNIKKLGVRLNKVFDIATVRNHLEHIEDRCRGYISLKDKNKNKKTNIQDFGNFIGNDFSFHNKKFPSDKKSLEELKNIYQDLINILHNNYASKDSNFIEKIKAEERIKLIQKTLRKNGLI